LFVSFLECRNV